jgi:hypothetical protein
MYLNAQHTLTSRSLPAIAFFLGQALVWADPVQPPSFFDSLEIGGEVRFKGEFKEDYNFTGSDQSYFLTRFRANGTLDLGEHARIFVEGQDARVFGENEKGSPVVDADVIPNIFENPFDLHQAYLEFSPGAAQLRAGRQRVRGLYDRLFWSKEWLNTSLVYDGILVKLPTQHGRVWNIFSVRAVPALPSGFDDWRKTGKRISDSSLSGIVVDDPTLLSPGVLKYFWLFRHNGPTDDNVHSFGTVFSRKTKFFPIKLEAAYQDGEYGGTGHQAWMFCASISKDAGKFGQAGFHYNYASGDGDPGDGKHGTFDNTQPRNHINYGYMDFFALQNLHSLEASLVKNALDKNFTLRLAYNAFWLDKPDTDSWYNAGMRVVRTSSTTGTDPYVGSEADLSMRYQISEDFRLEAGASCFFPGGYTRQTGGYQKVPKFFYLSCSRNF